jgi:predicted GNAT family acetyltransferase
MPATHPLDRPVWQALTTRWSALAQGDARAWRLRADHGVFAAAADRSEPSLAALAGLIPAGASIYLIEIDAMPVVPGTSVVRHAECLQMVASALTTGSSAAGAVSLDDRDAAEMLALATLTQPGPFFEHTNRLGNFIGIKSGERLVAMAGERMSMPGYTEVSAVCTHPDHRGRGYAAGLMRTVAGRILARGEQPILHTYASNAGANALYEALGFRTRQPMTLTELAPA